MGKYYAVKKGRQTGIFLTWEECQKSVIGYQGALYKSFAHEQEAKSYLQEMTVTQNEVQEGLIAYVDGSYNIKTKEYGYGCVLIEGQKIIEKLQGKDHQQDDQTMRNVAGEIAGAKKAVEYAIAHHYPLICLYYDYEGIEKWATKQWKANKKGTQSYQQFMQECQSKIKICFMKVLAHSGDVYNDMADALAKKAVGIQ